VPIGTPGSPVVSRRWKAEVAVPRICPQCQAESAEDAVFCPKCGTPLGPSRPQAPPPLISAQEQPHRGVPAQPDYGMAGQPGLGQAQQRVVGPSPVTGAPPSSVPPFSFRAARWTTADRITGVATVVLVISLFLPWFSASTAFLTISFDGISYHGFLYIVLFLSLGLIGYLVARAGWDRLPVNFAIAHAPVMLVATLANLALVAIAFLLKPSGGFGWAIGSILALICAVVAAAPLAVPALRASTS
jgi:zinc-ribbon domain